MTSAHSTPDQPMYAESLNVARHWESAEPVPSLSATSCTFQINQIVKHIDPPKVREIVETIFAHLLRLLDCLHTVESHLHSVCEAEETFSLFQVIHDEADALVRSIREDALTCDELNDELCDTLDGISFALS